MQDLLRFQLYVSVELATQIKDLTRFTTLRFLVKTSNNILYERVVYLLLINSKQTNELIC